MKYKYAYPKRNEILISKVRQPIRPYFDSEIEITELNKNKLKGNLVHFESTSISYIEPKLIRDEDFEYRKKYIFFGKLVRKPKKNWVRLKETSFLTIELNNYRVIYLEDEK
jgi:hypothetical protein